MPGDRERGRRGEPPARRGRGGLGRAARRRGRAGGGPRGRRSRPARRRSGGRPRARSLARFDWERVLAPLVGFCRAPAARPGQGAASRTGPAPPPARPSARLSRRALRRDVGGARGDGAAQGRRRRALELERPRPPRDLPGRARRPATIPACRGRCSCSTTDRATAPTSGCAARHPRRAPPSERGQPRLLRRQQPPRRGGRGRRGGLPQQRHAAASRRGCASWCARSPPRPADVAAVSGLLLDWAGERLDFARGVDDLRRPRASSSATGGRSGRRRCRGRARSCRFRAAATC